MNHVGCRRGEVIGVSFPLKKNLSLSDATTLEKSWTKSDDGQEEMPPLMR
jgi:hypothetical protein